METPRSSWLRKYSLAMYFFLAYAVTWCVQIPLALSARGLIKVQIPEQIHYLGAFGPLIAAFIVPEFVL
jgi:hypothetical protein